jgi:hypothetical protein
MYALAFDEFAMAGQSKMTRWPTRNGPKHHVARNRYAGFNLSDNGLVRGSITDENGNSTIRIRST